MSRSRQSRQEVRYCNRFGLGQGFYVETKCFYVMTEFGQYQEISCHDKVFICRNKVGQSGEVLCCDREFDVATGLPEIVSRQSTSYVVIESSRT